MYYLRSMGFLNQCECGNVLNVPHKTGYAETCPKCGKRLADQLVLISPNKNINLTDLPDLITYTSKASSKHEREAGLAESDGRTYTYVNEETHKKGHHINEVMTENGYYLTSYCYSGYYVKYDEINNLLVFIFAQRNRSTGWQEYDRFWIDQNKNIYFEGNSKNDHICQKMAFKPRHKKLLHNMTHLNETEYGRFENFLDEIKKLFPELQTSTMVKLQGNKIISVNDFSTFTEFLCYHPKNIKKSGKKQQKIDELIKIPLPDIIDPPSGNLSTERIAILNRVSDENCVLRMFSYLPRTKTSKEEYRMYIDSKDVYACSKTGGEWIYQPILKKPESYSFYLLDYDKRIAANTRLQYFSEIISEISPEEQSMFIWAFLRYPLVEQIYKAGYKNVVNGIFSICKTQNTALENCLVNSFLAPMKGKNLFQKLGLNAYQLDRVNKSFVGMYRDKKRNM